MGNREITNHHVPIPILEGCAHRLRRIDTLEVHIVSPRAQFPNHEFGILVRIFDHQNAERGAHQSTCLFEAASFMPDLRFVSAESLSWGRKPLGLGSSALACSTLQPTPCGQGCLSGLSLTIVRNYLKRNVPGHTLTGPTNEPVRI